MSLYYIFLSLVPFSLSQYCTSYVCGNLDSGLCEMYTKDTDTQTIQPCTSHIYPYCDLSSGSCEQVPAVEDLVAGQSCSANSNCLSRFCSEGHCVGTPLGGACISDEGCAADGYCSDSVCTKLITKGNPCDYDEQCAHGSGCDSGICKKYFSVTNYESISSENCNTWYYQSPFCESFSCFQWNSTNTTCIPALNNSNTIPHECFNNNYCKSTILPEIGYALTIPCVCGYNPSGYSYCDSFNGDLWPQNWIAQMKNYYSSGIDGNCNRYTGASSCATAWWDQGNSARLVYYEFMFYYQLRIYGADTCVLEAILPGYSYVLGNYTSYGAAEIAAVSMILIGLVI